MADKVKRLNYFNGQFLNARDFSDEQTYHSHMRQEHNRLLHTWGIADGLMLSADKGAMQVKVSPGLGIDIHGREIVLADEDLTDDLTTFAGKSPLYITIEWNEVESDKSTVAGVDSATRMELKPIIKVVTAQPSAGEALILGTVSVNTEGRVQDYENSPALRRMAGARGGDLSVVSLNLSGLNIAPDMQPRMTVTTAGQVDLQGSLQIKGNLGVTGNVGVGTTSPSVRLEINGALKFTNAGTDPNDGRIGSGLLAPGLNLIGTNTDSTHRKIGIWGAVTQTQNDSLNTWLGINFFNDSVGIGTAKPGAKLDVRGDLRSQSLVLQDGNGVPFPDNLLAMVTNVDGATNKWLHIGGITDDTDRKGPKRRMGLFADPIYLAGKVGIGTFAPDYTLDVKGSVRLGGFTADEKDEWPNVVWYRDVDNSWDEGLLKGDAKKSVFGRPGFGIHMHQKRHFGFYSTNWDRLVDIEGGSGKMYVKGGLHAGCDPTQRAAQPLSNPNQNNAAVYLGSSDIYFTDPNHTHTAFGNLAGYAAMENSKEHEALMILGRSGSTFGGVPAASARRVVRVWDYMQVNGNLNVTGVIQGRMGDLAEIYFSDVELEAGELVALDPEADRIIRSRQADDDAVIGIVSSDPGVLLNAPETETQPAHGKRGYPIALCGRVPCKVTDENGPIRRGDALTASSKPGHAMRAEPILVDGKPLHRPGTLVGKALEHHAEGDGVIEVFVTLR